jgi:hypothetical protein
MLITLETLDRTVFEHVRLAVVGTGKLPDWRSMSGATLAQKQAAFASAMADLRTAGHEIVEVFGVGVADARLDTKTHRVTVSRKKEGMGSIGAAGLNWTTPNGPNTFDRGPMPDTSTNVTYEVRVLTTSTEYQRLLSSAVFKSLGNRRSLKTWDGEGLGGPYACFVYGGTVTLNTKNPMEVVYTFTALDVMLDHGHDTVTVPALQTVTPTYEIVP